MTTATLPATTTASVKGHVTHVLPGAKSAMFVARDHLALSLIHISEPTRPY